jgi:hypothetical protein
MNGLAVSIGYMQESASPPRAMWPKSAETEHATMNIGFVTEAVRE